MHAIEELEWLNRLFFGVEGGESDEIRKHHTIAWEHICKAKEAGGLGIKRLHKLNIAFLATLGWRIITIPNQLWARVLKHKYGSHLDTVQKKGNATQV